MKLWWYLLAVLIVPVALDRSIRPSLSTTYEVSDDLGLGRRFDGIGGLSGGGPNFGASLQILKVEIGGDDQSTDGTESSHMHEEWDENYNRGYEWWLMKEAKARNPNIKLWGLSWAWPGFLGTTDPYKNLTKTATYTIKWIKGAKQYHNLDIDYIGIWNEKPCNFDYILTLRKMLDDEKLNSVNIVGCDGWSSEIGPILYNKTIFQTLYAVGVHYPGTTMSKTAIRSNKTLWSSEDYSTFNDDVGTGCWARILNQNYVNGYMTSTISWNLIASYYNGLPYESDGLMTAAEPWSNFYAVKNPIWITAHTTQFTQIGDYYLLHNRGVGLLKYGGSYVSFTNVNRTSLTIVIETLTRNHSFCIRPALPFYRVKPQKAAFKFGGKFANITTMHLWRTELTFNGELESTIFHYEGEVSVNQGLVMNLSIDSVYTLSTLKTGVKGDHGPIPESQPFKLPYSDNFEGYEDDQEPNLLTPQVGVWEVRSETTSDATNKFARQVILNKPVSWCGDNDMTIPIAVIGSKNMVNTKMTIKIRFPKENGTDSIILASRVETSGCDAMKVKGVYLSLSVGLNGYIVSTDLRGGNVLDVGTLTNQTALKHDTWIPVSITTSDTRFLVHIYDIPITDVQLSQNSETSQSGFLLVGTNAFRVADFDDLLIEAL